MNFEVLENFEWYNDPENVRFEDNSMVIYAKSGTEFWQSQQHNFKKDNGHFFYSRQNDDFILTLKWSFDAADKYSQCGIMVRIDERNWLKASMMNETKEDNILATSLTINGHSDWSGMSFDFPIREIWFRLQRTNDDYVLFYSLNGINFNRLKMFYLQSIEDIKVGAYIAAPNPEPFVAALSDIKFGV